MFNSCEVPQPLLYGTDLLHSWQLFRAGDVKLLTPVISHMHPVPNGYGDPALKTSESLWNEEHFVKTLSLLWDLGVCGNDSWRRFPASRLLEPGELFLGM